MPDLDTINRLDDQRASDLFAGCCGASRWVAAMTARRPFASRSALYVAADAAWSALGPDDWREAFRHHPRIGESTAASVQGAQAGEWSAGEQASVASATDVARAALREINDRYERRFGFIYIVCAAGRSPGELLAIATARLSNQPDAELRIAAEEQRKIMRLRLEKLLNDGTSE